MQRILLVDDHAVIRKGIQHFGRLARVAVCGEVANGEEVVRLTKDLKPDIVLMDISVPGMGGLEATRAIRKICPDAKVLMLTLHDALEWVETALNAGARGYLLKSDTEGELMRALKVVMANGIYASPCLHADRVNRIAVELGLVV